MSSDEQGVEPAGNSRLLSHGAVLEWLKIAGCVLPVIVYVVLPGCTTRPDPALEGLPSAGDVVISDETFNAGDWTVVATASNSTQSAQQETSGGNPGAFRHMFHSTSGPNASVSVRHRYTAQTYNPSAQGAITSIDYREDRIEFNPPFAGAAIGSAFVLEQGGNVYTRLIESNGAFSNASWITGSLRALTAADFGSSRPDFSASGGPITFGFLRSNSNSATATGTSNTEHGIDNWSVTIHRD